jgi:hypothetical protein
MAERKLTIFGHVLAWSTLLAIVLLLLPRLSIDKLVWIAAGTPMMLGILGAKSSTDPEWTARHKSLIVEAFAGFGILGLVASWVCFVTASKETAEANQRLATSVAVLSQTANDSKRLAEETGRMQRLNTELQERLLESSKTIARLAKTGISTATGGDSFAYVHLLAPRWGIDAAFLQLFHRGQYPLYDVTMHIYDEVPREGEATPRTAFSRIEHFQTIVPGAVGLLDPNTSGLMEAGSGFSFANQERIHFDVSFQARNGSWYQGLSSRRVNGTWLTATRVFKRIGKKDLLILEIVDPGFPKNAAGQVLW